MTKVAVLSDSHDNLPMVDRAVDIIRSIRPAAVLHAGDIISPFSLKRFSNSGARLFAVYGNNDGERVLLRKIAEDFGYIISEQPLQVRIGGYEAVILHGTSGKEETRRIALSLAKSGEYDLVVYGHTHEVDVTRTASSLVVNPGELCGYLSGKATFAVVDLEERGAEIIEL